MSKLIIDHERKYWDKIMNRYFDGCKKSVDQTKFMKIKHSLIIGLYRNGNPIYLIATMANVTETYAIHTITRYLIANAENNPGFTTLFINQ